MPCVSDASAAVVKDAVPPLMGDVPMMVEPSTNRTLPVAAVGDSLAVKVTGWPGAEGFGEEARVMLVAVRLTMVNVKTGDVLMEYVGVSVVIHCDGVGADGERIVLWEKG